MAAVTICSDFGAPENKLCPCFHCFPTYFYYGYGNMKLIGEEGPNLETESHSGPWNLQVLHLRVHPTVDGIQLPFNKWDLSLRVWVSEGGPGIPQDGRMTVPAI